MIDINIDSKKREQIIKRMVNDRNFRLELVMRSHFWFCHFYFRNYITFETAEFQKEMLELTESEDRLIVVVAFRGCGKSTDFTLSYPIWAILGTQQKKCVVILSQTQRQARQHLMNLKHELERNRALINDLGPFQEESDEWGGYSLVMSNYKAKIIAASSEQSLRGIRHLQNRPDLVVADDIEDLQSVKTQEGRDKTYEWLRGDVIPAGGPKTKIVIVGSLLHNDSVTMRLKRDIEEGRSDGVFKRYPIIDERGRIAWPGKYPDMAAIELEKKKIGDRSAWQREFMIEVIAEEDQVILENWLKPYDEMPDGPDVQYRLTLIAVDPAMSQKESADYTAIVAGSIFGNGDKAKLYIHPSPINERFTFQEIKEKLKSLSKSLGKGSYAKILIEEAGTQGYLTQELKREGFPVEGVKIQGDKKERLGVAGGMVEPGRVLFPRQGVETLKTQLLGFGRERHDDLVDAFSLLVIRARDFMGGGGIFFARMDSNDYSSNKIEEKKVDPAEEAKKRAEEFYRQQQEQDRGLFNMSMEEHIRRAKDQRFWEDK